MPGAVKMKSSIFGEVGGETTLNGLWIAKILNEHCNTGLQQPNVQGIEFGITDIWFYPCKFITYNTDSKSNTNDIRSYCKGYYRMGFRAGHLGFAV